MSYIENASHTHVCHVCRSPYTPARVDPRYPSRACSAECRAKLPRRVLDKSGIKILVRTHCATCGDVIEGPPSKVTRARRYCSRECTYLGQGKSWTLRHGPEANGRTVTAQTAWARRNPHKVRAWKLVHAAILAGELHRADACEACGRDDEVTQAHHWSYEPGHELDVIWLCDGCHHDADVERRALERGVDAGASLQ